MTATYTGLVPDTFKDGAEVVAKGTLTPENQLTVVPDGIMAKCPSRYTAGAKLGNAFCVRVGRFGEIWGVAPSRGAIGGTWREDGPSTVPSRAARPASGCWPAAVARYR